MERMFLNSFVQPMVFYDFPLLALFAASMVASLFKNSATSSYGVRPIVFSLKVTLVSAGGVSSGGSGLVKGILNSMVPGG